MQVKVSHSFPSSLLPLPHVLTPTGIVTDVVYAPIPFPPLPSPLSPPSFPLPSPPLLPLLPFPSPPLPSFLSLPLPSPPSPPLLPLPPSPYVSTPHRDNGCYGGTWCPTGSGAGDSSAGSDCVCSVLQKTQ